MLLREHLKLIREMKNLSQSELARRMNYDKSHVSHMESGTRAISLGALEEFRRALEIQDVPLTIVEKKQFLQELQDWIDLYAAREYEKGSAFVHQKDFAQRAKWSLDPYLITQYELACLWHYITLEDDESFKEMMSILREKEYSFDDEQRFRYYHMIGLNELYRYQFKHALVALLKAETMSRQLALTVNCYFEILYYQIAYCLTEMDYAYLAIEYLAKAEKAASDKANTAFAVYIRTHLAVNYSKIGKTDEALLLLESCLREESNKKNATGTIGWLYSKIGRVHHRKGDYVKANDFYDMASQHITDKRDYLQNLFFKAEALFAQEKIDECVFLIEKGLEESDEDTIANTLLVALNHSLSLEEPESLEQMETKTIPKLIEYGQHLTAIEYIEKLSSYFGENRKHKQAAYYNQLALKICKLLMEGNLTTIFDGTSISN